jgi:hypothetical protein
MSDRDKRLALLAIRPLWLAATTREGGCACLACFERLVEGYGFYGLSEVINIRSRSTIVSLDSFRG